MLHPRSVASCGASSSHRSVVSVRASISSRRSTLLGGAGLVVASPLVLLPEGGGGAAWADDQASPVVPKTAGKFVPADKLSTIQKRSQLVDFSKRATATLLEFLGPEDAPACIRLALQDAGTYDRATKAGGATGAVVLQSGSLPSSLKPVVEKLKKAKTAIDAGDKAGAGPISWADLIYLAGKVSVQAKWRASKGDLGAVLTNPWDTVLGRMDSDKIGPNKVPSPDASVAEITSYFLALNAKPGQGDGGLFAPKAPFWEKPAFLIWAAGFEDSAAEEARLAAFSPTYADVKKEYDQSRETVSKTVYEIDFGEQYNKLSLLGATLSPTAYLYPEPVLVTKF